MVEFTYSTAEDAYDGLGSGVCHVGLRIVQRVFGIAVCFVEVALGYFRLKCYGGVSFGENCNRGRGK